MNYQIAIPSYKRSNQIKEKTLNYLEKCKIDKELVTVFVANETELEEYKKTIGNDYKIVLGVPVLVKQRNFITNYYPENEKLVCFDDDVIGIFSYDGKSKLLTNLDEFIKYAFDFCEKQKIGLWGITPSSNPLSTSNEIKVGLYFLIGYFFGKINHHEIQLEINFKDDYEQSIRYFLKYGKVARFNKFYGETKVYGNKGGLQEFRKNGAETMEAMKLLEKYPEFVAVNKKTSLKRGIMQIKLSKRKNA